MKIYTLDELLSRGDDYAKMIKERIAFQLEVKSKVRHKIVTCFDDFDSSSKKFLLRLKKEVFNDNTIYVIGSRVNGTYLTDEEYEKYSKEYQNVKKSDWDIRSKFDVLVKEFEGYKIDFQIGTKGVKV